MQYIELSSNLPKVSTIGAGLMRISQMSNSEVDTFIRSALEDGINFFDEADIYGGGKSEEVLGNFLVNNPSLRDQMVIQSKCGIRKGLYDFSKEYILSSVDGILSRLHTDHLDSLLLHRPDVLMDPYEVKEAFEILYSSGKVLSFGVSNQNPYQMDLLQSTLPYKLTSNQVQLSCAHTLLVDALINVDMLTFEAIHRDGSILPYLRKNKMTLQAWSPLQAGFFEGVFLLKPEYKELTDTLSEIGEKYGVSASTIAYAWILRLPCKTQVITGTTKPQRLHEASVASEIKLTREEWYRIYLSSGHKLP